MQAEEPPVDSVWTVSTPPLAGQPTTFPLPYAMLTSDGRRISFKESHQGHVVSTTPPHE